MQHWEAIAPKGLVPEHSQPTEGQCWLQATSAHQGVRLKGVSWPQLLDKGLAPCAP